MKVVYMGTPDFAVAALEKIIEAGSAKARVKAGEILSHVRKLVRMY